MWVYAMNGITTFIKKITEGENLTEEDSSRAFQIVMNGGATPAQIAGLLVGLRMKGETVDEITGAVRVMRAKSGKIAAVENALDTCGTGGDASGSYNISTAVAFVVAGCGVPVAKHGNKAISSRSGSADVLALLGVNLEADSTVIERALREAGICFMMAPKFHTAMRHVGPVRQELAIRTIFNILGPLANPADARYQLLGVYAKELAEPMAKVLKNLGSERAWVVHGSDGMDELTTTGSSFVAELKDGEVTTFEVTPAEAGLEKVEPGALRGGDVVYNAQELKKVLMNQGNKAYRDIVLLNAGAALIVAGKATDLADGVRQARESLESGKANEALLKLVEFSNL